MSAVLIVIVLLYIQPCSGEVGAVLAVCSPLGWVCGQCRWGLQHPTPPSAGGYERDAFMAGDFEFIFCSAWSLRNSS